MFPATTLQTYIAHLIRNSLGYAGWKDRKALAAAWHPAGERVIPFFAFPPLVRKVIYTTNAIESVNARLRNVTTK